MKSARATLRSLGAEIHVPRLLAALTLAAALVAIPAVRVEEASARRTSERSATNACNSLGGALIEVPLEPSAPDAASDFYCDVWWGFGAAAFQCSPASGPFGGILNCNY